MSRHRRNALVDQIKTIPIVIWFIIALAAIIALVVGVMRMVP